MRAAVKAVCALAAALVLSGCPGRQTPADAGALSGTLIMGNAADPATLDPTLATGLAESKILSALFEGLVTADTKTLEILPAAAESWTKDGLKYRFKIRAAAKWSDGEPLKASDFVFAFRRILDPAIGAEYSNFLFPLKNAEKVLRGEVPPSELGARAVSESELEIELERPCPHFLSLLYHPAYFPLPEHAISRLGARDRRDGIWMRPENAVSNGPFTLEKWRINDRVRAVKNPGYWDAGNVFLNAVEFIPISNINTEDRAFRAGQLHMTESVAPVRLEAVRRARPDSLRISDWLGVYYYSLNTARPPLDDPRVRRALSMSIRRGDIISNFLRAGQKPALSFVPEASQEGYSCPEKAFEDAGEARRLLAEAGYPGGKGFPKISITYNTSEQHRPIAEAVQAMWRENLGIDVELYNVSWPAYLDIRRRRDFFITRSSWVADYASPESFLSTMTSSSGLNHSQWKSEKFDALMEEAAAAEGGASARAFALAEAEIIRDAALIPVYFYSRVFLIDPRVSGWHQNPLDYHNYKGVGFRARGGGR